MIPPETQHRFGGDSGVDLAAKAIEVRFPDGARRRVVLRLGHPYRRDEVSWIRAELEGLESTAGPFAGDDDFQALLLGISWLRARLTSYERAHHCRYYWAGTESIFDFRRFFAPLDGEGENEPEG